MNIQHHSLYEPRGANFAKIEAISNGVVFAIEQIFQSMTKGEAQ